MPITGAGVSIPIEGNAESIIAASNATIKELDRIKAKVQSNSKDIENATKREQAAIQKTAEKYSGSLAPGLQKAQNAVGNFMSANSALIGTVVAVGAAAVKSYQAFQQYAGSVRDVALASGTSAEEASKLLQVLDDYEISAQDVMAATKAMTKQGLEPSIDTLARLSDEYVKINDPMEKNEFILKNLGKAGLQWANALNQGGDALRKASEEANKNLILTDEQIEKAEMARLAVDAWADSWEGFKVSIGGAIGNIIAVNDATQDMGEQFFELTGQLPVMAGKPLAAFEQFRKEMEKGALMTEHYKQMYSDMADGVVDDTAEMQQARGEEIKTAIAIQSANNDYIQSQDKITESLVKEQAELDKLNQGYYAYTGANAAAATELANITNKINAFVPGVTGSQQELHKMMQTQNLLNGMLKDEEPILVKNTDEIEKQTEKVKELQDAQKTAAEEFGKQQAEKLAMMAVGLVEMSDGEAGFTDAEAAKAEAILATADVAEAAAFRQARAFEATASAIASGAMKAEDLKNVLEEMSKGYTIDVAINLAQNVAMGNMAASGGGSMMAGNVASGLDPLGNAQTVAMDDNWAGGTVGSFANGGQAGGWGLVGDRQGGGFIKGVSELIFGNARVFNSKDSEKMLKSGKFGKLPGFAIGGNLTGGAVKPWGSTLGGGGSSESEISSMPQAQEAVNEIAAQVASQVNITMQAQMTAFVQSIDSGFEQLGSIMLNGNPRAVGKFTAAAITQTQV